MKVLIVEDDPEVSAALQDLVFERTHGVVVTVQTRQDAYREMKHPIDLAILDVDVTDGRSLQIAGVLQKRHVSFIFVSNSSPDYLPQELRHAQFLPKPFDEAELRRVVSEAATHHAAEQSHDIQSKDPEYSSMSDKHQVISDRARQIWHEEGEPEGRDEEIWLLAERLVAIDETASAGPVNEIETVRRTLEAPLDSTGHAPVRDPHGGQAPAGGSDLLDQTAGGKRLGTGKAT